MVLSASSGHSWRTSMGWFWIVLGAALIWVGWDALGSLVTRHLRKREVAERVFGPGAPELSEQAEHYVRTRMLIQGPSLAQLMAIVFSIAGLAAIVFGIALLLE
jgi:hypothetical protein